MKKRSKVINLPYHNPADILIDFRKVFQRLNLRFIDSSYVGPFGYNYIKSLCKDN